jgi:hypothetical protein
MAASRHGRRRVSRSGAPEGAARDDDMGESSNHYHEPYDELSEGTRDMHRALVSVTEELEAIDWYQQRMDACGDEDLKGILGHNLEEEVEHACKGLEWIRRPATTSRRRWSTRARGWSGSAATTPCSTRCCAGTSSAARRRTAANRRWESAP